MNDTLGFDVDDPDVIQAIVRAYNRVRTCRTNWPADMLPKRLDEIQMDLVKEIEELSEDRSS